ncbi:phosphate regulon sensor histidine kinase PhoR [Neptuniibacter caesariensis]|uniref:Phosphate regulon sensor protein PhoR n=1 Tax=Neptuniibacter caesariensis TaxID=207954 RepID=A0A7U8C8J8_NEPCE|nr:phosphate regulon sensor histidine kinase PhoR [Neptuniibacter caesariensis]EAR62521.1 two-component sensor PhoR [Oceanospirillum sp. MED92] [Neptuniibacter caesariensis]
MQKNRHSMFTSLLLVSGSSFVLGLAFGYPSWFLALALIAWSLYQIRQFNKLTDWLQSRDESQEPPEAPGHWGELFDELSRIQRRQSGRENRLRNIITRFQESTSALPDAILIIDKSNNMEWWNGSANRLLGLSNKDDRGKPVMNLLRDPRFIRYYKRAQYTDPITLPSPAHTDIQIQYQITRFGEGDRILVARDVSRLMRLEQTRQDFVANASHELRTPLTVIRGYLETFLDQELPRPLLRGLGSMQQQARRMENLVSDLLLLSRLEASHQISDEQPIQLQSVVNHIMEGAEQLGNEKGHRFKLDIDPDHDLCGQEIELHSAFSNLVYNAVRYTPSEGDISVKWWVDDQGAHFSVKDNGPGIESIHLPRLTERFYRVDESRSSASGGTGLGLAIVKHVLARHNGQLTIKSKIGKGSTFACHFPLEMVVKAERHDDDDDFDGNELNSAEGRSSEMQTQPAVNNRTAAPE